MTSEFIQELRDFLVKANLSTYCINTYLVLLDSRDSTAKEIAKYSGVPIGRIYEILEELENKGMVTIHDSRPKTFSALPLNRAMYNLVNFQTKESKRKSTFLFEQAKILEAKLYHSEIPIKTEPSKIFYSTVLGTKAIIPLYIQYFDESQEELLINEFINETTLKVLSLAEEFFQSLNRALKRGVQVKVLWSLEYDRVPLTEDQKNKEITLFNEIKEKIEEFGLPTRSDNFGMKFIHTRVPTYYDIIDKKRVLIKLQNPSRPWQIFASLNIVDPLLARELRKHYYAVWQFDSN
ncbi:MAG: TrmB family transcriptional regulator [Candidatus Hodarchaeota archaeon]